MQSQSPSGTEGKNIQNLSEQEIFNTKNNNTPTGTLRGRTLSKVPTSNQNLSSAGRVGHIAWGLFLIIGSLGTSLLFSPARKYIFQQFATTQQKTISEEINEPPSHVQSIKELIDLLPLKPLTQAKITDFFQKARPLLGEERYNRICSHMNTLFGKIEPTEKCLKIFLLLMFDIQKIDVDELGGDPSVAYKTLIPFESFDEFKKIFSKPIPSIEDFYIDKVKTSGKGIKGLEERVFLNVLHHFQVLNEQSDEKAFLCDSEMLSARFIDREHPQGSVIHLKEGFFHVDKTFGSRGAYVAILKDIKKELPPKIVCRGTALRRSATSGFASGINDILPEIGMWGVQAIWPSLSRYLKDQKIASVEILGKSLGGAIAQELAVLTEGIAKVRVNHLITVCSVGVGKKSNELFLHKIIANRKDDPFIITVLRNKGNDDAGELDYAPILGGEHLGANIPPEQCTSTVYGLSPINSTPSPFAEKAKAIFYIKKVFKSLGACHCRQTTLKDFDYSATTNPTDVNKMLLAGEILERIRRSVTFLFKKVTFHQLDYSLEQYFHQNELAL